MDDFVMRANIEHYQRLLATALDDGQRRAVTRLLEAELRKTRRAGPIGGPCGPDLAGAPAPPSSTPLNGPATPLRPG